MLQQKRWFKFEVLILYFQRCHSNNYSSEYPSDVIQVFLNKLLYLEINKHLRSTRALLISSLLVKIGNDGGESTALKMRSSRIFFEKQK
jgi:hypothetical protein